MVILLLLLALHLVGGQGSNNHDDTAYYAPDGVNHIQTNNLSHLKIRVSVFKKEADTPMIEKYLDNRSALTTNIVPPNTIANMSRDVWICWRAFFDFRLMFGFGYELVWASDGEAAVLRGDADMTLFMKTIRLSRTKNFTFPQPLRVAALQLFFKKPQVTSLGNLHLRAFAVEVWYTFLGTVAIFYIFTLCFHSMKRLPDDKHGGVHYEACWIVGTLTGKSTRPFSIDSKIAAFTLIIAALYGMLIQTYLADSIISALKTDTLTLSTVRDLLRHGYKFTTHEKSDTLQSCMKAVLKGRSPFTTVDNEQQITHLLEGQVASLAYTDFFFEQVKKQNFSDEFFCGTLAMVKVLGGVQLPRTTVLQKNSKFVKHFNYGIIRIREVGLNQRYYNEFREFENVCSNQNGVVVESFGWEHVHFPFYIIICGVTVSAVIGIVERCLHSKRKQISRRRRIYVNS